MTLQSVHMQVVNCLASGVPIVTPDFFRDLGTCVTTKQKLPLEEDYLPEVSRNESESQLRDPAISFKVNPSRARLLAGKTVVFLDKKQYETNSVPCRLAGGAAVLWPEDGDPASISRDQIVIKPAKEAAGSLAWTRVSAQLASLSVTACPATDIYLAIVHCSTQFFCNPAKKSAVLAGVTEASSSAVTRPPPAVLAPETCTPATPSPAAGGSKARCSRVQVGETPSTRGSLASSSRITLTEDTQVLEPLTGDTQVGEVSSSSQKRPRGSEEDEEVMRPPPTKQRNTRQQQSPCDKGVSEAESCADIFASSASGNQKSTASENFKTPTSDLFTNNEKENSSANSNKQKEDQQNNYEKADEDEDEDDDDLFGFGSLKPKKKRPLSTPDKIQSQAENKRLKHVEAEEEEEDIFGFGTIKKEPESSKTEESQRKQVQDQEKECIELKNDPVLDPPEYSPKASNQNSVVNTTGFIGKLDIKVKSEVKDDGDAMSSLNSTVANISLTSMLRPRTAPPSYAPHPDPAQLGKPVTNFKKFRKQQTGAPRAAISLVQYVPSAMNQTVIADWFKDNAEVTIREQEQEKLTQECDEFWEFEASQTGRKKKLTNSRR